MSVNLPRGTCSSIMKNFVFMSSTLSGIPRAMHPISFPADCPYTSLYCGLAINCQYVINFLVSLSIMAPANPHNNWNWCFWLATFACSSWQDVFSSAALIASSVITTGTNLAMVLHAVGLIQQLSCILVMETLQFCFCQLMQQSTLLLWFFLHPRT